MVRSGETCASSIVSLPSITRTSATVWSVVICEARASRMRYVRLSPTWATNASEPATSSTSSVVPMPCLSLSRAPRWNTAWCAARTAFCSSCTSSRRPSSVGLRANAWTLARAISSDSFTVSTAIALATSPAAWPPMPSATMKNCDEGSTCAESSLCSRTTPISVTMVARSLACDASSVVPVVMRMSLKTLGEFSPEPGPPASLGAGT